MECAGRAQRRRRFGCNVGCTFSFRKPKPKRGRRFTLPPHSILADGGSLWSAPAERSGDGALAAMSAARSLPESPSQSGVDVSLCPRTPYWLTVVAYGVRRPSAAGTALWLQCRLHVLFPNPSQSGV